LGNLTPREIGPKKIDWEPPAEEQEIFLNVSSNLAWVFLGYPAPHFSSPDYPAMKLIYLALGEGISSKIWEELREKNALAYDLSAIFPELKGPSHIIFYVVTTPENTWAARKKLLLEINKIKKDGLLPQELKEAKNKFLGEYLLDRETNKGKAYNIGLTEIYELGYPYDFNLSKKIEAITNEEIKRIANLYLNNYTLIIAQAPNTNNIYYEMFR
ncbi:MAG: insulinase family protein, partial [Armatimonadetes bacterium]|nr:insulinase family protein [Armatimonadota bacterium]